MAGRQPYKGATRKLLLAFDVGTTFSGISYSILDPGAVPEILGVNRFPAQEAVGGDCKIPTIIYYDAQGNVRAVGAEALDPALEQDDEFGEWTKAEWHVTFKLHLRPKTKSGAHITHDIPALPRGKTAVEVFADFLRYLHQCARTYIEDTHATGVEVWKSLQAHTEVVLTHPNGWEGAQQGMMRKAAVMAGLVPDTESGLQSLSFVTEGEASLHFCVQSGLTTEAIKNGKGIIIVDAGGGTIDISTYKQTSTYAKSYQEIAAPQCHFKGSIFVTSNAKQFLQNSLKNSRFLEDVPHITNCFDKATKLRFRNAAENQYIKFGTLKDKDANLNIRSGQLKLLGSDVASFFEPSVKCIVKAVNEQIDASDTEISSVFLVGGFAASEWLFSQLKSSLSSRHLDITRPDSHVNKAVADGAISYHIDHFVAARVSKLAYGTRAQTNFNHENPEHIARISTRFRDAAGRLTIGNLFAVILPKNTTVTETQEFRRPFDFISSNPQLMRSVRTPIMFYRGQVNMEKSDSNYFMDEEPTQFYTLCNVQADTSCIPLPPKISGHGQTFYQVNVDVILCLGLTELKAYIGWKENGVEKRSPAELVYDPDLLISDD